MAAIWDHLTRQVTFCLLYALSSFLKLHPSPLTDNQFSIQSKQRQHNTITLWLPLEKKMPLDSFPL